SGLLLTLYYVVRTHPCFGGSIADAWLGINPVSAGAFRVPLGIVVTILLSLLTAPPSRESVRMIDFVRSPEERPGETARSETCTPHGFRCAPLRPGCAASAERWMSGLSRTPGKRVWDNIPTRVRIPPSPPRDKRKAVD